MTRSLLSIKDAARELGVSLSYAYMLCHKGDLKVSRVLGRLAVTRSSVNAWKRQRERRLLHAQRPAESNKAFDRATTGSCG